MLTKKNFLATIAVLGFLFSSPVAFADTVTVSATPNFTGNGSYWSWSDNDSVKKTHAGIFWEWPTAYRMESVTLRACVNGYANPTGYYGVYVGDSVTGNIGSRASMPLITHANPTVSIASTTQCSLGWTDYTIVLENAVDVLPNQKVALIPCSEDSDSYPGVTCHDNSIYPADSSLLRFEGGVNNFKNRFYGFCYSYFCGYGNVYEFATSTYGFQPAFRVGGSWISPALTEIHDFSYCALSNLDVASCVSNVGSYLIVPDPTIISGWMTRIGSSTPFAVLGQFNDYIGIMASGTGAGWTASWTIMGSSIPVFKGSLANSVPASWLPLFATFRLVIGYGLWIGFAFWVFRKFNTIFHYAH